MLVILLLLLLAWNSHPYKILVVNPKIAYSHMNFMGRIADILVEAGHDVPVLSEYVDNGTMKSYLIQRDVDDRLKAEISNLKGNPEVHKGIYTGSMRPSDVIKMLPPWARWIEGSVTTLLKDKELMEFLKAENFDVGIAELFDFIGIAVFEAINLKNIIGTHSYASLVEGTAYAIGVPVIPSFIPATQGVTDDSASFSTRATNLMFTFYCWYYQKGLANAAESAMVKELGKSATPIWDSVSNMSYILTNSIPYLDFAKPSLHNIVEIGGIGVKEPRALGKEWDRMLGLRSQTVLISFGTLANSSCMPDQIKKAIVKVAKSFSGVTFIWKYEDPDNAQFASDVENLFLTKWTPQSDLLADDRLSLFVTHGGAGSLTESAYLGTPLVVVPLFADQLRNAMLAVKFGFGLMLDKEKLYDSKALGGAIGEVLREPKYRRAAHRVRGILAKQPLPREKLIRTVELAAEFGPMPELRLTGRNLGVIAYYNLDIFLLLIVLLTLITGLVAYILRRLISMLGTVHAVKSKAQ
ncbi:unnamed protein product [Cylicocyclus nassatus]|uniref:UDP-glucuronosyltransferase n=1 Tax=Cylicocyclus nassatus TaxID=53992 RepID=A0AA36H423_CYLNA|nr:unnamed protein product [Cylicocyclus nassatus]